VNLIDIECKYYDLKCDAHILHKKDIVCILFTVNECEEKNILKFYKVILLKNLKIIYL